mmetsp:Transcript_41101/g.124170  ORF Transcript_41101/g.124170 Transcript_41101/m.124170 type:complete len:107 (-) Transcript_41101:115-435(-)
MSKQSENDTKEQPQLRSSIVTNLSRSHHALFHQPIYHKYVKLQEVIKPSTDITDMLIVALGLELSPWVLGQSTSPKHLVSPGQSESHPDGHFPTPHCWASRKSVPQ